MQSSCIVGKVWIQCFWRLTHWYLYSILYLHFIFYSAGFAYFLQTLLLCPSLKPLPTCPVYSSIADLSAPASLFARHFYWHLKSTPSGKPRSQTTLQGVTSGFSLKNCNTDSSRHTTILNEFGSYAVVGGDTLLNSVCLASLKCITVWTSIVKTTRPCHSRLWGVSESLHTWPFLSVLHLYQWKLYISRIQVKGDSVTLILNYTVKFECQCCAVNRGMIEMNLDGNVFF